MSTSGNEGIFLPGLDRIELTGLGLVNIPSKLESICQIDNGVVPLVGMQDDALCSVTSCRGLYRSADTYNKKLPTWIQDPLRQPLAVNEAYGPCSAVRGSNSEA